MTDRRRFLLGLSAALAASCSRTGADRAAPASGAPRPSTTLPRLTTSTSSPVVQPLQTDPVAVPDGYFGLGVASGDPSSDGVVLWTRGTGPALPVLVPMVWEVAADPAFTDLVATGRVEAGPDTAHAVHVPVTGLDPASSYHYRFRCGDAVSPVGRTRTLPDARSLPDRFRIAVSSCQLFETGHYAAHRHLADEDVDLVVWLGDFIYEGTGSPLEGRSHRGGVARDLEGYRDRYAQYRSDPSLRAAQAAHPWVVVWDDHEVVNDVAGSTVAGAHDDGFDQRRADAYRAWWENQPVGLDAPAGAELRIHRRFDIGSLARLFLLDTRQYRDPQPCRGHELVDGFPVTARCAEVASTSLLGDEQRAWLLDELGGASDPRWTLLGQQVLFGGFNAGLGSSNILHDTWDGYAEERRVVAEALGDVGGAVILTGDLHAGMALDVRPDPYDLAGPVVAAELMAPAISSPFPASAARLAALAAGFNAQIAHFDPGNGYLVATLTPERLTAEFRTLADVTDPDSPIATTASFTVERDRPGLQA